METMETEPVLATAIPSEEAVRRGSRLEWLLALGAVLFVAALVLSRLSSFGIWDPWELNSADEARQVLAGDSPGLEHPPLGTWLVASGFGAFGVREWAGRLPVAVSGVATVVLAFALVSFFAGRRAGIYAALIAGTSALFLFNARQMLGDAPALAAQTLVAVAAMAAIYLPWAGASPTVSAAGDAAGAKSKRRWIVTGVCLAVLVAVAVPLSGAASGLLIGALPPLVAAACVAGLDGILTAPRRDPRQAAAAYGVVALATILVALVLFDVLRDHAEFSGLRGGKPIGGDPPTFEKGLEAIFHSFVPWSAVLPLAVGRMLWPRAGEQPPATGAGTADVPRSATLESSLALFLLLWAACGYGATMLFVSRYGPAPYLPVVALAGMIALLLRDVERSRSAFWGTALITTLLGALVIRDFDLYPGSVVSGLGLSGLSVPDVFNPKREWTMVMGAFIGLSIVTLIAAPATAKLDLLKPYRFLRGQLRRGLPFVLWAGVLGLLGILALAFGAVAFIAPDALGLTTLAAKAVRAVALVPIAVPVTVLLVQLGLFAVGRLGRFRVLPILLGGAVVGAYAAQVFLPELSSHFSPREVYDTYNELAAPGEALAEYRVGGRAAAYYARGDVREVDSQAALLAALGESERVWAAFPAEELPAINRAFRGAHGRHLFVADARSARVVLATNRSVDGVEDQNFLARFVLDEAPRVQHPVGARFEDKIELIGYDLELPHDGYVGAGESFTITWYFRALAPVPGSYKAFVHVDGRGQRMNGDHDPVDGKYPVRLWDQGDVVVDVQELSVPANYRPGSYTFFVGFYSGNGRLSVVEGPKDDADRVSAGVLTVR